MKAQPLKLEQGNGYIACDPCDATHLGLHLPGPLPDRIIPVMIGGTRAGTPCWTWNGSTETPTVKPSILTKSKDEDGEHVCHSFVNDGKATFLSDCTHEFAGMTKDLLDVVRWAPQEG